MLAAFFCKKAIVIMSKYDHAYDGINFALKLI